MDDICSNGLKVQDSFWTVLTTLGTFLASAIALFVAFGGPSYFKKPKLIIEFKNKEPFSRHTIREIIQFNDKQEIINKTDSYWLRFKIRNTGGSTANKCKVKLLAIIDENIQKARDDFDPTILRWVENYRDGHSIDIDKKDYEFVNLLCINENSEYLEIQPSDVNPRGISFIFELADYYFVIIAYSENADPQKAFYKFKKNEKFDKVQLLSVSEIERIKIIDLLDKYES
jgi:hypothetical protein